MKKTPANLEESVLESIFEGICYADISKKTGVSVSAIKKIKKRNHAQLNNLQKRHLEKHLTDLELLVSRTHKNLNILLDKADRGEVQLSIRDLLAISSEMYRQTRVNAPPYGTPNPIRKILNRYL